MGFAFSEDVPRDFPQDGAIAELIAMETRVWIISELQVHAD